MTDQRILMTAIGRFVALVAFAGSVSSGKAADAAPAVPTSAASSGPNLGDTVAEIEAKLGSRHATLEAGNRIIYQYPNGEIVFVNGRVTEVDLSAPAIPASTPAPTKSVAASALRVPPNPAPETPAQPQELRITYRKDAEDAVSIIAVSDNNLEFTITVNVNLKNTMSSVPLPVTVDSAGQKTFVVVQLRRADPTLPWSYQTSYKARPGARRAEKSNDAVYLLPYQSSETLRLDQGNFGTFSHFVGSGSEYAFDFKCPEGTIVCAAREGIVTGVRQDSSVGGPVEKYKAMANYIIIKQADGTFAEYVHLQHNGAMVTPGQHVDAGQAIGKSGATGYASGPHIHFSVFQNIDGQYREDLPVRFKTKQGVLDLLKQGESY